MPDLSPTHIQVGRKGFGEGANHHVNLTVQASQANLALTARAYGTQVVRHIHLQQGPEFLR